MSPADWKVCGDVKPTADAKPLHADFRGIYRIVTADGQLCAPGWPTVAVAGVLMRRDRVADVPKGNIAYVYAAPFSIYGPGDGGGR